MVCAIGLIGPLGTFKFLEYTQKGDLDGKNLYANDSATSYIGPDTYNELQWATAPILGKVKEAPEWVLKRRVMDEKKIYDYMDKLEAKEAGIREKEAARVKRNKASDEARKLRYREAEAEKWKVSK